MTDSGAAFSGCTVFLYFLLRDSYNDRNISKGSANAMSVVRSASILIPQTDSMQAWSVIACDQFTSDPSYWKETETASAGHPSTLELILPEVYIGTPFAEGAAERISKTMKDYLSSGLFREHEGAFVSVEREVSGGRVRRGIIAAIDLEQYEYRPEAKAPLKATEATVTERLYKRLELREKASVELPHVIVFYNDPEGCIRGCIEDCGDDCPVLYDFDLMQQGGHIRGKLISGDAAARLQKAFDGLEARAAADGTVMLAVGDGNHSLATAKLSWDTMKASLSEEQRENHPARFALVELEDVYDEGIGIEPIHRAAIGIDPDEFADYAEKRYSGEPGFGCSAEDGEGCYCVVIGNAAGEKKLFFTAGTVIGDIIALTDRIIEDHISAHGGKIDFIHDASSAEAIGREKGNAYVLLPTPERADIFKTVSMNTIFPRKSFSVGSAREKRYYLECRKIK